MQKKHRWETFYSYQIYMYLLGVVHHGKDSKRVKDDIHNYTWMEQEKEKTVVW